MTHRDKDAKRSNCHKTFTILSGWIRYTSAVMTSEQNATPAAKPTPPPAAAPAPAPTVAERAQQKIAEAKTGFDITRPFRRAFAFARGTIEETVGNALHYGRRGLVVGLAVGVLAGFAASSATILVTAAAVGFGVPLLAGGLYGFLTGGQKHVARMTRAERYAGDLVERAKVQAAAPPARGPSAADRRARREEESNRLDTLYNERFGEINRDVDTYWRDRVSHPSSSQGLGM
jgi:hypothetical protein